MAKDPYSNIDVESADGYSSSDIESALDEIDDRFSAGVEDVLGLLDEEREEELDDDLDETRSTDSIVRRLSRVDKKLDRLRKRRGSTYALRKTLRTRRPRRAARLDGRIAKLEALRTRLIVQQAARLGIGGIGGSITIQDTLGGSPDPLLRISGGSGGSDSTADVAEYLDPHDSSGITITSGSGGEDPIKGSLKIDEGVLYAWTGTDWAQLENAGALSEVEMSDYPYSKDIEEALESDEIEMAIALIRAGNLQIDTMSHELAKQRLDLVRQQLSRVPNTELASILAMLAGDSMKPDQYGIARRTALRAKAVKLATRTDKIEALAKATKVPAKSFESISEEALDRAIVAYGVAGASIDEDSNDNPPHIQEENPMEEEKEGVFAIARRAGERGVKVGVAAQANKRLINQAEKRFGEGYPEALKTGMSRKGVEFAAPFLTLALVRTFSDKIPSAELVELCEQGCEFAMEAASRDGFEEGADKIIEQFMPMVLGYASLAKKMAADTLSETFAKAGTGATQKKGAPAQIDEDFEAPPAEEGAEEAVEVRNPVAREGHAEA